jgi:hypothetical protein
MQNLRWPANLSEWHIEITKAARENATQGFLNVHVSFRALNPRAKKSTELHEINIGGQISLIDSPLVTYFIAIGENPLAEERRVVRKVHFDLHEAFDPEEPKPVLHLQLTGGLSPGLAKKGYGDVDFLQLRPDIEKPRIACLPQSFALLLHQAMLEYHSTDDKLARFVSSRQWLSVVAAAECTVWKPFFDHGSDWFNSTANRDGSLISCFYGLSIT